jgi:enoyl-CoA hydratase/carnithine racemase
MNEHVQVSRADGICEIRLNRPDKRNAITLAMYSALREALQLADEDDSVRAVLLSGAGAGFTGGNDLKDFLNSPGLDGNPTVAFLKALPTFQKVLIAAVHGQTVGIGVTLLLHCDLVVAARGTQFSMPFVPLGLVPEAASSLLLPRLVGYQRAAELLLLGKPFSADAAFAMGLVNKVVDEDALMSEARALAAAVVRQPAGALRATKRLLRSQTATVPERLQEELLAFQQRLASEEFRKASEAFFSKR